MTQCTETPSLLAWAAATVGEPIVAVETARSHEVNQVLRLQFPTRALFLKAGPGLRREYDRLCWLEGRIVAPRAVGFHADSERDALLMTALDGEDLASLAPTWPREQLVLCLAAALRELHAVPVTDWPFETHGAGATLVHGDACLPNFLFSSDRFTGYIDLGELAVGSPEVDLSAALWSLQYNCGPGLGPAFLRAYGAENTDPDEVERLRRMYELREDF